MLGSFSAAARKLGKSQSTVSTAIANLEIDLGLNLFDRSSRKPMLTEHGRVVLHRFITFWPPTTAWHVPPANWPVAWKPGSSWLGQTCTSQTALPTS